MAEYDGKLFTMSSLQLWSRSLHPIEIGVRLATGIGLVLRHSHARCKEPALAEQTAVGLPVFALLVSEVAVDKCYLVFGHLGKLFRLAVCGPCHKAIRTHSQGEEIKLILVAALQECDVLSSTVGVCRMRLQRQYFAVSFRECVQCIRGSSLYQLLGIDLQQVGNGLAV